MRASTSLALRLFLAATTVAAIVLVATGLGLSALYSSAVERSFDRRLGVYLKALVADVASAGDAAGAQPADLGEPLFGLPLSGWYWQITRLDSEQPQVRTSGSLFDRGLPRLETLGIEPRLGGAREGYAVGPGEQRLRIAERVIDLGEEGRYLIAVGGDADEIELEIRDFDRALAATFALLGLGLVVTALFQVSYGLRPLQKVSRGLAEIRAGAAERLEGRFPSEIAPLVGEMNALVDANREIVERARTHVSNLAHALKTPLSVLVNEAGDRDDPLAAKVREQADIMRSQVARHLERARVAARATTVATATEVAPVVASLVRTMEKIHARRALTFATKADAGLRFRGERHDLEEMLGNLVDNAAKWAATRVEIEVLAEQGTVRDRPFLRLVVDDDGSGLTPAQRDEVAKRGKRLDETKPGTGFGLAIVADTAAGYGGRLVLGAAPAGGLRAELVLPAV